MEDFKELLSFIVVAIAIALNYLVNRKFKKNDIVPCLIDIPKEVVLLSLGFIVTYVASSTDEKHATIGTIIILAFFFISLIIYATCQYSSDTYLGFANTQFNTTFKNILPLVISISSEWIISISVFYFAVTFCFGGQTS